ncbi:unnamed protein product [Effrenium voratum]|nr:unnamed protein product [Effrenium voratum]
MRRSKVCSCCGAVRMHHTVDWCRNLESELSADCGCVRFESESFADTGCARSLTLHPSTHKEFGGLCVGCAALTGLFMIGYILVFMLVSVGIFNLIMAIFLDNVVSEQTLRKQKELAESALKSEVAIKRAVAQIISDEDSVAVIPDNLEMLDLKHQSKALERSLSTLDVTVTRDRFAQWLAHEDFVETLEGASVDTSIRTQLFDILDADSGGLLSIDELISGLMSMRGHVTKGDIIAMSLKVRYVSQQVEILSNGEQPQVPSKRRSLTE